MGAGMATCMAFAFTPVISDPEINIYIFKVVGARKWRMGWKNVSNEQQWT